MENLEVALHLASLGFYVFPCIGAGKPDQLKKPWPGLGWRHVSTTDERAIRALWNGRPSAVPGVDCDKSGLLVVDCDCKHGPDGRVWVASLGVDVDHTPGSITPSGGQHLIYRNPNAFTNGRGNLPGKDVADLDIRGKGGFIIGPGARFADGRWYKPVGDLSALEDLPEVIADYLSAKRQINGNGEIPSPTRFNVTAEPINDRRLHVYGQVPTRLKVTAEPISEHRLRVWSLTALDRILEDIEGLPPGNRQDPVASLAWKAGQLAGNGSLSEGEVIQAIEGVIQGWSDLKEGYLGEGRTVRRQVRDGMRIPRHPKDGVVINLRSGNGHLGMPGHAHDLEIGEVVDGLARPYEWIDPKTLPRRDWLYGTLLIRKFVSITVAPGGLGKSSLATVEALSLCSGRDLIGIDPKVRRRVWLWNLEDPYQELQRRIQATAKFYELEREDIDGLYVNSGRDQSLVIARMKQNNRDVEVVEPMVEALVAEIKRLSIDVLVVDPFVSSNEVDENDNKGQDKVVKAWARVADLGECAVHLIDHANKKAKEDGTSAASVRGASAKVDAARVVRVLNSMSPKEAEKFGLEPDRYFSTAHDKSNMSLAGGLKWYRKESVCLENGRPTVKIEIGGVKQVVVEDGDSVGVITSWKYPALKDADEGVDWAAVVKGLEGTEWRKDVQAGIPKGSLWIGKGIADAIGLDVTKSPDNGRVKRMIELWLSNGKLVEYLGKNGRKEAVFIKVFE